MWTLDENIFKSGTLLELSFICNPSEHKLWDINYNTISDFGWNEEKN